MIDLHWLYVFAGAVFAAFAFGSARDRTQPQALGQRGVLGACSRSASGSAICSAISATACWCSRSSRLAGAHLLGRGRRPIDERPRSAQRFSERFGNKLFLPALIIPFTAFVGTLLFNYTPLKDSRPDRSQVGDARAAWPRRDHRARHLLRLAAAAAPRAGRGGQPAGGLDRLGGWCCRRCSRRSARCSPRPASATTIGAIAGAIIPHGSIFLAVLLYALGMVVFTMIMGNAFAAFPVMVAAIGVPILIHQDGGNPAVIGAVGMLAGFCGTLMTPMAANFNIVPAALLELKNQYGVIKAQVADRDPAADRQHPDPLLRGVPL